MLTVRALVTAHVRMALTAGSLSNFESGVAVGVGAADELALSDGVGAGPSVTDSVDAALGCTSPEGITFAVAGDSDESDAPDEQADRSSADNMRETVAPRAVKRVRDTGELPQWWVDRRNVADDETLHRILAPRQPRQQTIRAWCPTCNVE